MFIQEDIYQSDPDVMVHIMTQLSLKWSLKWRGNKAYAVVMSEMKQLHLWNTYKPKHWNELSKNQYQTVLKYNMILNEKRDGYLKGRTVVAGGNKQWDYFFKEDASLPTITTEAILTRFAWWRQD
jgi:CO dehydrogenase/acetyl-CoA synthase delta subunit